MRLYRNNPNLRQLLLHFLAATLPFLLAAGAAACNEGQRPAQRPPAALRVVTTTTIIADWARQVAGDRADVVSLVPNTVDPHGFAPGPRDVAKVAEAGLVLTVGLNLEAGWMDKLLKNAAADPARVLALGDHADPIPVQGQPDHGEAGEAEGKDGHGPNDPHFWQDPLRVKKVLPVIAARLALLDPAGAAVYQARAADYSRQLDDLHRWAEQQFQAIPKERRLLVTSHEAFGYLAHAYGFRLVGTVIPGGATTREPSAAELARLVREIKSYNVPAVFAETILNDRLARRIADEAGVRIVTDLYSDALGENGSDADTYLGMARHNVRVISENLKSR